MYVGVHSGPQHPPNATRHPVLLGGHKVYGAWFDQGNGYRAQNTSKVAVDNEPETICESTCLSSVRVGQAILIVPY
eukprot:COSAG02_NODE_48998_length_330_cov_0.571429_1_plen_76_part_00